MNNELSIKAKEPTAQIVEYIVNGQEVTPGRAVVLTLPEFKNVYIETVHQLSNQNPYVVLIFFQEEVLAMFPQHCPQTFRMPHPKGKFLTPKDFEFVIHQKVYGLQKKPPSFGAFLASEIKLYWKWLLITFILSSIGLHFSGKTAGLYQTISAMLMQSVTVFVSIFLIFTVTQNVLIQKDIALFRQGLLHRYRRDDRNVALLGIIVIVLVILNMMFVSLPYDMSFFIADYELNRENFWGAVSTGLIITLLLDAFISVVGYYLERSQDVVDRDLSQEVFKKEQEFFQDRDKKKV